MSPESRPSALDARPSWLQSLPHQIPFRAASAATRVDDATIEGTFVCTANDPLPLAILAVEAMAQLAGGLAFHDTVDGRQSPSSHAFLTGMDDVSLDRPIVPGEIVRFTVTMNASFGGTFRFAGSGSVDGVEVIRGKFYLASPDV
jgi:3-hydroxymyristoyl/3-hydroxydecanoyl-(acyl carrier protein) dehydratase